jgi:hypothetical protein
MKDQTLIVIKVLAIIKLTIEIILIDSKTIDMIVKTQINILKQNIIDQIQQIITKITLKKIIMEIVFKIITIKVKNKLFVSVADNLGILLQIAQIIIMVVVEIYKTELMIFYLWEDKISIRKKIIKLKVQMGKM